jgi:putative selenate reductase FAD-binding subunit
MITTYHRPQTLEEVIALISRPDTRTLPLGGGTFLSHLQAEPVEVVDLQALGLNQIKKNGNNLEMGATTTLQQLIENPNFPNAFQAALKLEAPLNIRNAATVAGTLVVSEGRSTFATIMLALDAKIIFQPDDQELLIGTFLPLRKNLLRGKVITKIVIPLHIKVAFQYISRTPSDKPIVCMALTRWPSGRTRLAVGGYGKMPLLAMDGTESAGLEAAARNAFNDAGDNWASAEYRQEVAGILINRCLATIDLANG